MKKFVIIGAIAAAIAGGAVYLAQTGGPTTSTEPMSPASQGNAMVEVAVPAELSVQAQMGKTAFDAICADCHGSNAAGNATAGPPLIHKVYEPSHHGDMSFQLAVQNGVRAHHWKFGNMPAQDGLTKADVSAIIAYVRELQRENGIN